MLSNLELNQYNRQLILPEFGLAVQEKLKQSKVLVTGAGGLGCPALQYLAAAGIGELGIIDGDVVHISNLHRQVLYTYSDVGKPKAEIAKRKIHKLNRFIRINAYTKNLTIENVERHISNYDVVIDCTDNLGTRYLINDFTLKLRKPFIYGAIHKYEGMVSVFNYSTSNLKDNISYRDLFPVPTRNDIIPNCNDTGVIGVLPGIIGTMQANEAIKVITGIGIPLIGKLFVFDALTMSSQIINISKSKVRHKANSDDYLIGCGNTNKVKEVTSEELTTLLKNNTNCEILDIRENNAVPFHPRAISLPFSQLETNLKHIARDKVVIVCCDRGFTSLKAITLLEQKYKFDNLHNLKGGIQTLRL